MISGAGDGLECEKQSTQGSSRTPSPCTRKRVVESGVELMKTHRAASKSRTRPLRRRGIGEALDAACGQGSLNSKAQHRAAAQQGPPAVKCNPAPLGAV